MIGEKKTMHNLYQSRGGKNQSGRYNNAPPY
jgi:hypothetical protein